MKQLNFCRQMKIQFQELIDSGMVEPSSEAALHACISMAEKSQKFILPKNGFLIEDKSLRGIDESAPINLPFNRIAIEYECDIDAQSPDYKQSKKRIVFAEQTDIGVMVLCVNYLDKIGMFHPFPPVELLHSNFIDRESVTDGCPDIKLVIPHCVDFPGWRENRSYYTKYCTSELRVLTGFLSALSCSNVKIDKQFSKKTAKTKSGIPFDDYHVLTVELAGRECGSAGGSGSHRSPREHLRRGHIRRLSDGRRIWVNAAVVCSGKGFGVVTKDYRVKH